MILELWAIGVLLPVLVAAAVTDLKTGKILNAVTYPAIVAGFAGQMLLHGADGFAVAAGGFAMGFVPLLICWLMRAIGGGDVKLLAAVGALSNWQFTLAAMFYAFVITAVMGIAIMIRRRIVRRTLMRIARSVAMAMVPRGPKVSPTGPDSPKVPFGLALCLGVVGAIVDSLFGGPVAAAVLNL